MGLALAATYLAHIDNTFREFRKRSVQQRRKKKPPNWRLDPIKTVLLHDLGEEPRA
jgi:hypothetical protein